MKIRKVICLDCNHKFEGYGNCPKCQSADVDLLNKYRQFTKDDEKWIRSFERVMKKAPEHLFMFVGAGITIYPERVMGANNSVDQNGPSISIQTPMDCDGGDF